MSGDVLHEMVMSTQTIFPAIESGDVDTLRVMLDADPGLVHAGLSVVG